MTEPTTHVFLLGCRASGKTSFLSGLATLTRGGSDSPFQLIAKDGPTAMVFTDLRALTERQTWPPPTSSMTPLTFRLSYTSQYGDRHFEIALLDYPGEDLLEAMQTLDFEEKRPLEEQFKRADYVLIAADPTQDLITPLTTDQQTARRRQDALRDAIGRLATDAGAADAGTVRRLPAIAILITKADLLGGDRADAAQNIARGNKALLLNLGRLSSSTPKCFLVSSCGMTVKDTDGQMLPPEMPKPVGYHPLFDWMSRHHFYATHRKKLWLIGAIITFVVLLLLGYCFWSYHREATLIRTIENGSIGDVIDIVRRSDDLSPTLEDALDLRVKVELDRIATDLDRGPSGDRLKELAKETNLLAQMRHVAHSRELQQIQDQLDQARDESLFGAVKAAERSGDVGPALTLIAEYRRACPSGIHHDEIEIIYTRVVGEQQASARGRVRTIPITNRDSLASKAKEIRSYLKSYADDPDATDMGRAASVAEDLATCDQLRLRMRGCGFSAAKKKRYHEIRWFINSKLLDTPRFTSDGQRTESTLDHIKTVSAPDWSRMRIDMWDLNWGNEKMASADVDVLRDLALFDGRIHFTLPDESAGYWVGVDAYVIFEVQWREDQGWSAIPAESLQAYGRFIQPGRDW